MPTTQEPEKSLSVLIVGAGIGGLTAAICCALKGFEVEVIEQAKAITEVGAGIQLQPNATRVLLALDLGMELERYGVKPDCLSLRAAKTGKSITSISLTQTVDGLPYYHIHRADLQNLLLDRAKALGVNIVTGESVTAYSQNDHTVSVKTKNNQTYNADLLVAADGLKSAIRTQMFTHSEANTRAGFTGHVCFRGTVDARKLARPITPGGIVGPGRHFVSYYLRNREMVNFVAQYESEEWKEESWSTPGDVKELRGLYRDWDPQVTDILNNVEQTYKWALYTRPALPWWSDGRVCLMGDACHPTLPNLASGAGMAIEDAYIVAELLNRTNDPIPETLEAFYKLRIDRCTKIQKASESMASFFHIRNPMEKAIKYNTVRLLTKLAPNLVATRMTWTHHYNALAAAGLESGPLH